MGLYKPPANDAERLMNVIEGLASVVAEDDDQTDEEIRAELAANGVDLAAWAAGIRAKAEARLRAEREARARKKRARVAVAAGGLLAVGIAATVALVIRGAVQPDAPPTADVSAAPVRASARAVQAPPEPAADAGARRAESVEPQPSAPVPRAPSRERPHPALPADR